MAEAWWPDAIRLYADLGSVDRVAGTLRRRRGDVYAALHANGINTSRRKSSGRHTAEGLVLGCPTSVSSDTREEAEAFLAGLAA